MSKPHRKERNPVPPQLVGILADAVGIGATSFRIEPNPPHMMASFSKGSRAMEIDFEDWAGQEMMDFFVKQVRDRKTKAGQFGLEHDGRRYECQVTLDRMRDPQQAEVAWAREMIGSDDKTLPAKAAPPDR